MGRAAQRNAAGEPATARDDGELEELVFHWGSAYHLAVDAGVFTARRRDGKGGVLADPVPEGLYLRILADYEADPVPRDLS